MIKNNKICFLFGAGAEAEYGLPLGDLFSTKILFNFKKAKDLYSIFSNETIKNIRSPFGKNSTKILKIALENAKNLLRNLDLLFFLDLKIIALI